MFLLDTNTVSELKKVEQGRADLNVVRWNESTDASQHWLSVITILELYKGVLQIERKDPTQGALLRQWLEHRVVRAFHDRILPVDATTARICAGLHVPNPKPDRDALIAATALQHDLILVTRNVKDFADTAVKLINPWLLVAE